MLPLSNFVDAWRGPIPEIHVSISIHFSSKHQKLHLVGSNVYPTPSLSFQAPQVSGIEMQDSTEWIRGRGYKGPQIKRSLGRPGLSKGPDIRFQPLCSPHVDT